MIPRRSDTSGFTLIEMMVVCAILIVIALFVLPSIQATQRSRAAKDQEAALLRLPTEAKNDAVQNQSQVHLRVSGNDILMERVASDGTATLVKQVTLTGDMQVTTVQLNGQPSDTATWAWNVYPDGTANSGGIEFSQGTLQSSLALSTDGAGKLSDGALPDQSQDQWPAGTLLQRG